MFNIILILKLLALAKGFLFLSWFGFFPKKGPASVKNGKVIFLPEDAYCLNSDSFQNHSFLFLVIVVLFKER
jgi:hypothetical protein